MIAPQIGFNNVHHSDVDIDVVEQENNPQGDLHEVADNIESDTDSYIVSDLEGVDTYAVTYDVEVGNHGTEVLVEAYEDEVAPRIFNDDLTGATDEDPVYGMIWFDIADSHVEDLVEVDTTTLGDHDQQSFDWIKYQVEVTGTNNEVDDGTYTLANFAAESSEHVSPHQFQIDLDENERDQGGFMAFNTEDELVAGYGDNFEDTFGADAEVAEFERLAVGTGTSDEDTELNLQYNEVEIGSEELQPVDAEEVNGTGEATLPEGESVLATVIEVSPFVDTEGEIVDYTFSFQPPAAE